MELKYFMDLALSREEVKAPNNMRFFIFQNGIVINQITTKTIL